MAKGSHKPGTPMPYPTEAVFGNNPKIASPTSHHHSRNQMVRHAKVQFSKPKGLLKTKAPAGEVY
jgi:hypothetical protein